MFIDFREREGKISIGCPPIRDRTLNLLVHGTTLHTNELPSMGFCQSLIVGCMYIMLLLKNEN